MPEVLTGLTFSHVDPNIYQNYQENHDAEVFEQLVFDYMLNKHSDDQELKDYILNLPRHQKRTAIVSVIDGDNNLWNQLHTFIENCPDKLTLVKNIIHIINKFVKDGEVEKKKFGEVMTPISLVKEMLDTLPKEVWSNPNLKWLDPANGAGTFPFVVIYKLMNGLAEWEPNIERRYRHIVENMIYTCELQSRNVILWLLGVDPRDEYTTNTYWGSFLDEGFDKHMKEVWGVEKFDVVLGNPPYQEMDGGHSASAKPIYNLFTDKSISISQYVLFVIPSRWFAGGKGLAEFRSKMMYSNTIRKIKHFGDNGQSIFGKSVNIGGGVSYLLIDSDHHGLCNFNGKDVDLKKYDIILRDTNSYSIVDKMIDFCEKYGSLESIAKPRSFYGVSTNDRRLTPSKVDDTYIKCFVSQHKGFTKYIKNNFDDQKINIHKVATPRALGNPEDGLGNIFYVSNNEIVTDSYMFLLVKNESQAKSLISYLSSNFTHYLVCLRKIDASIKPSTFKWLPLVPLDRIWTDYDIYNFFKLNQQEIDLIEKNKKK